MNAPPRLLPHHFPTLTEVVDLPGTTSSAEVQINDALLPWPPVLELEESATDQRSAIIIPLVPKPVEAAPPAILEPTKSTPTFTQPQPPVLTQVLADLAGADIAKIERSFATEPELTHKILQGLNHQLDTMIESRLLEALTPALVRVADALVQEVRTELASSLRELVERAVRQELSLYQVSTEA